MYKKIRLGMIGGGINSMIGNIHRHAALLDSQYELTSAVFSRDFNKTKQLGNTLKLKPERLYTSYNDMFLAEKNYSPDERIEVVSIVTPNDSHFAIAKAALESDLHIIIDKPITQFSHQAIELKNIAKKSKKLCCITYVFAGYPMLKEARQIIAAGKLGKITKVIAEFYQGWLSTYLEGSGQKQASWRMDPKHSLSGTITDIGTHVFHLAEYVTGLTVNKICADLNTNVPKRLQEDDGTVLVKFNGDVSGIFIAAQMAAGNEADLSLRVYGEKGHLHWQHNDANTLTLNWFDKPTETLKLGSNNHYLHPITLHNCRTPAGHPEGYIEAFANHYRNFAMSIHALKNNMTIETVWDDYPKIEDGLRGVFFIENVLASHKSNSKWLAFKE